MPGEQTCEGDVRLTCPRGISWPLNLCSSTSHSRRRFQLLLAFIKTKLHFHLDCCSQAAPDKYIDLAVPKQLHPHLCNHSQQLQDCIHLLPACGWTPLQQWHTPPSLRSGRAPQGPEHFSRAGCQQSEQQMGEKYHKWGGWGCLQRHVRRRKGSHCHPPFYSPSSKHWNCVPLTDRVGRWGITVGLPALLMQVHPGITLHREGRPLAISPDINYSGHCHGHRRVV